MRTSMMVVVVLIAGLAIAPPAEAHCTWRHVGHCVKDAFNEAAEVVAPVPIVGQVAEKTLTEVANAPGSAIRKVEDGAESFGRKTGLDDVEDLGRKLGSAGMLLGAAACTAATAGTCALVGSAAGSLAGSLIEGESTAHVGTMFPMTSATPGPEGPEGEGSEPKREPGSVRLLKKVAGVAFQQWLMTVNTPVQMASFKRDYWKLAYQVPFGEERDAWVLVQGHTYQGMTLNPDGFLLNPVVQKQYRVKITGAQCVRTSLGGVCLDPIPATDACRAPNSDGVGCE